MNNLLVDGSLKTFIARKIDEYIEPQRKGTPRGESIGYPRSKFAATLFSIAYLSLAQIARSAGVNRGVYKKWRTEVQFKSLVESHAAEFVNEVVEVLRVRVVKHNQKFHAHWTSDFDQIEKGRIKEIDIADFESEVPDWGEPIVTKLLEKMRGENLLIPPVSGAMLDLLGSIEPWAVVGKLVNSWFSAHGATVEQVGSDNEFRHTMILMALKKALECLAKAKPADEDRKTSFFLLRRALDQVSELRRQNSIFMSLKSITREDVDAELARRKNLKKKKGRPRKY